MRIRNYDDFDEPINPTVIEFDSAIDRWVISNGSGWEPFSVDLEDVLQWVSENQPQLLTGLKMQGAMHSD